MGPELSGFALGLLFAAAKVGAIGTIGFAIAWWRARRRLQRLDDRARPDAERLEERLASLEQATDYVGARLTDLADTQALLIRQLEAPLNRAALPRAGRDEEATP